MYRAFYALPLLTNAKGEYTNAIHGFFSMLLLAMETLEPTHMAVCFDVHAKTLRSEKYEAYKAQRKPMPEELRPQFPLLDTILQEMDIAVFKKEGIEGDDLLGTLAKKSGMDAYILTGDRDCLQLLDDTTKVCLTKKGVSELKVYDTAKLFEEYGLKPEQIPHLKGLMGDASDNIPGVAGVGEKTALKLLLEYSTIENLYEHVSQIKGKLKEKLENDRDKAFLSLELATIDANVDVTFDIHSVVLEPAKIPPVLNNHGFKSLAARKQGTTKKEQISFDFKDVPKTAVYQDICFDKKTLLKENPDLPNITHDCMIAQYCISPTDKDFSFAAVCAKYGVDPVPESLAVIREEQLKQIQSLNLDKVFYEIESPLTDVLHAMETCGFCVDETELTRLSEEYGDIIKSEEEQIIRLAGEQFNINSPKQLGEILFDKLKLPAAKKTKTGYSTDAEVLEGLEKMHPIIPHILNYRQYAKLNSTYIEGIKALVEDGHVHTSLNQASTVTGRISSTEPNLQNIPQRTQAGREIRKIFCASQGQVLTCADYSQIELRILAHISKDENMLDAFLSDRDIHTATASEVFDVPLECVTDQMRREAKAVNFGIVYGISDFGLAKNLGVSRKRAHELIEKYLTEFSGVAKYMEQMTSSPPDVATTLFGRRRVIHELKSPNKNIRSFGLRVALNTPIQGTAADIIKLAMNNVHASLRDGGYSSKLILQVHDELIVDTALEEQTAVSNLLRECMEGAAQLLIPLKVNISSGRTWFLAK